MSRFSPSERVAWVSPSGIRREGAVVEELPGGLQWAVQPDGGGAEVAVDRDKLNRVASVETSPPSVATSRATVESSPRRTLRRPGGPEHGTRALYKRGCRCLSCTKANRDYNRAARRKCRGGTG